MNVFDCAIKIEDEAKECYLKLRKECSDPELKRLFALLADAEEEHRNRLEVMKREFAADSYHAPDLAASACSFRPRLVGGVKSDRQLSDPDFYRHAITEEEEEIRYLEQLGREATDDRTRSTLRMVAEEERRHLSVVENIYSFVEGPKNFLAWGEFSNLKDL